MAHEVFSAPDDLTLVGDADLAALEESGVAEFNRVDAIEEPSTDELSYAVAIRDGLSRVRTELQVRQRRAQLQAEQQRVRAADQMASLRADVIGTPAADTTAESASMDASQIAQAAAQGVTAAMVNIFGERRGLNMDAVNQRTAASLASLSETSSHAPAPKVPTQRLSVTASVDIPGVAPGNDLVSLASLAEAFSKKARALPVTRTGSVDSGHVIATVRNAFPHSVDDRTSPAQVGKLIDSLVNEDTKNALVAGGGWCAPSEIRYDFFNVACSDGLIDLPTIGITRGGIQWPVSPSIASAFGSNGLGGWAATFSNASVPWLWTEDDDIATVTGSPNKPCLRVPCPTFDEARLDCYGICLTAGNLTDDAYPEATQNTLRYLMVAHERAINTRLIALMVAASSAAISTGEYAASDAPAFQQILSGLDLGATDYRARYGMCSDDVIEVVLPYWVREVLRADLAWRSGVDMLSVADGIIRSYFSDRNLRPQFVNDWQVRGSGQFGNATAMTAWPTTVDVMMYAAGTFVHGQGMSLDLGVIRDSVLNAENDFTAAWSEECHLIAKVGHESRQYRITFQVMGATSVASLVPGTNIDAFPNL